MLIMQSIQVAKLLDKYYFANYEIMIEFIVLSNSVYADIVDNNINSAADKEFAVY